MAARPAEGVKETGGSEGHQMTKELRRILHFIDKYGRGIAMEKFSGTLARQGRGRRDVKRNINMVSKKPAQQGRFARLPCASQDNGGKIARQLSNFGGNISFNPHV